MKPTKQPAARTAPVPSLTSAAVLAATVEEQCRMFAAHVMGLKIECTYESTVFVRGESTHCFTPLDFSTSLDAQAAGLAKMLAKGWRFVIRPCQNTCITEAFGNAEKYVRHDAETEPLARLTCLLLARAAELEKET